MRAAAHAQGIQAQIEMREGVMDRRLKCCEPRSGSPISRLHQSSAANSLSNCGGDQSPPQSPAAGRRSTSTAIEPSLPLSAISSVASRDAARALLFAARQLRLASLERGDAALAHGTHRAGRIGAAADGRAQIHDGLRVARRRVSPGVQASACAQSAASPRRSPDRRRCRTPAPARAWRCHRESDAARRATAPESRRRWSARSRVVPSPRRDLAGNSPPCCATRDLRAGAASFAPARSTPAPSTGAAPHRAARPPAPARRKPRHEALVVRDHGGNLGLLQHDLGHPYPVGRGVVLPRQIMAAVHIEPGEQPLGELLRCPSHFRRLCPLGIEARS